MFINNVEKIFEIWKKFKKKVGKHLKNSLKKKLKKVENRKNTIFRILGDLGFGVVTTIATRSVIRAEVFYFLFRRAKSWIPPTTTLQKQKKTSLKKNLVKCQKFNIFENTPKYQKPTFFSIKKNNTTKHSTIHFC